MTANVGGIDRILRIVAGIAILSLFFVLEGNARYWALIGIVPALIFWYMAGMNCCP